MRQDADRARAKELFRSMTPKGKADYIFHYYWLHMLVGVFALIVAVVFVITYRANAATRGLLYVGIQADCHDFLRPKVEELAQQADWPEGLNFVSFPSAEGEDGMGSMQLTMYLAADELDFIVCDEYTMRLLSSDETMDCRVFPVAQSPLDPKVEGAPPLYLVVLNHTGRGEKVEQFLPVLVGDAA